MDTPASADKSFHVCACVSPLLASSPAVASHLFVETLQLHLQGLQEALPLCQLALGSSQSLVALLHLVLHGLKLDKRLTRTHQPCSHYLT